MLGCVIGNNSHAEGKIVAPARFGVERAQFPVDSMMNRLDVVFDCFSNEDGELTHELVSATRQLFLGHRLSDSEIDAIFAKLNKKPD
jgi:hypothetical protein